MTISKHIGRYVLIFMDLLALILFVWAGQTDHGTMNDANPIAGILPASWEFALLWLLVGWPLNAFPRVQDWTIRLLLSKAMLAWLVAAPLALLLRSLVLSRLNIPSLFMAATLGFGILFLWFAFGLVYKVASGK